MSMFRRTKTRAFEGVTWDEYSGAPRIPVRTGVGTQGLVNVTQDRALTHSAVWACVRLRADLISTFPVDVFRDMQINGQTVPVEMPKPPILVDTGGIEWSLMDWMWASQRDLDMSGNAIGRIVARNGIQTPYYPQGLPAVIELADPRSCSVIMHKGERMYRIDGKMYRAFEVFHERQYPISGSPVGASTLINAARSIGEYLSLQQYGLDWFAGGGIPKAWMKNTVKRLADTERDAAKRWYTDTVENGSLMVTGNDWEYNMIQAETAGMEWLEGRRFGLTEVSRFFAVPSDLIDAAISGQSVTYANITERNLQFLIMNLNAAVIRREATLTRLLPQPRYVKMNTDGLLRMSPAIRQAIMRSALETWQLTLDESRGLENRAPLTAKELERQREIYGTPKIAGAGAGPAPEPVAPADQQDPEAQPGNGDTSGDPAESDPAGAAA
jgi:HK97 family phage portal protein